MNTLTHKLKTAVLFTLLSLALASPLLTTPVHAGGCDSGCVIIQPDMTLPLD